MGFGVDRCWFLWSLGDAMLWVSSGSWVLVWISINIWVICGLAMEEWILVWIGCGSVVEVCGFWFGLARWVCFGLKQRFCGFAMV